MYSASSRPSFSETETTPMMYQWNAKEGLWMAHHHGDESYYFDEQRNQKCSKMELAVVGVGCALLTLGVTCAVIAVGNGNQSGQANLRNNNFKVAQGNGAHTIDTINNDTTNGVFQGNLPTQHGNLLFPQIPTEPMMAPVLPPKPVSAEPSVPASADPSAPATLPAPDKVVLPVPAPVTQPAPFTQPTPVRPSVFCRPLLTSYAPPAEEQEAHSGEVQRGESVERDATKVATPTEETREEKETRLSTNVSDAVCLASATAAPQSEHKQGEVKADKHLPEPKTTTQEKGDHNPATVDSKAQDEEYEEYVKSSKMPESCVKLALAFHDVVAGGDDSVKNKVRDEEIKEYVKNSNMPEKGVKLALACYDVFADGADRMKNEVKSGWNAAIEKRKEDLDDLKMCLEKESHKDLSSGIEKGKASLDGFKSWLEKK